MVEQYYLVPGINLNKDENLVAEPSNYFIINDQKVLCYLINKYYGVVDNLCRCNSINTELNNNNNDYTNQNTANKIFDTFSDNNNKEPNVPGKKKKKGKGITGTLF